MIPLVSFHLHFSPPTGTIARLSLSLTPPLILTSWHPLVAPLLPLTHMKGMYWNKPVPTWSQVTCHSTFPLHGSTLTSSIRPPTNHIHKFLQSTLTPHSTQTNNYHPTSTHHNRDFFQPRIHFPDLFHHRVVAQSNLHSRVLPNSQLKRVRWQARSPKHL